MLTYSKKLNKIANSTNSYLKHLFSKQKGGSYLLHPMKYGIFSGGKRFRSAIVVNTGKIFDIDYKTLIKIGAAVECIHSYSLIHDDLPAMDNDDLRRGKLTTHKKFNEFTAILAGNSLLTLAFEILSGNANTLSPLLRLPDKTVPVTTVPKPIIENERSTCSLKISFLRISLLETICFDKRFFS